MTPSPRHRQRGVAVALTLCFAAAAAAAAQTTYRVRDAKVVVKCPLTVGGSFKATTEALTGSISRDDGGALSGELEVDLTTLETGIDLRDRHLREKYLEVESDGNDTAVLFDVAIAGDGADGLDGAVTFAARFKLHGVMQSITGSAKLRPGDGSELEVAANFPVNLPDYQIKKPRHLGIGVKDTVTVDVELTFAPAAGDAAGGES